LTHTKPCPHCGQPVEIHINPVPTVDLVIDIPGRGIVFIKRGNPPWGWALPGGFVDYGETVETAAVREAKEETGLDVTLTGLLGVYSAPDRDPRGHTLSVVFTARAENPEDLKAGDDAAEIRVFAPNSPPDLAFDHSKIVADYAARATGQNPKTPG